MNNLPAGIYYVGDLCYVLPEDDYDDIICSFQYNDGDVYKINGYTFAVSNTAYGDGCYLDSFKNEYPVDAGIIGILRLDNRPELLSKLLQHNVDVDAKKGYPYWKHNLFTFAEQFSIGFSGGVFRIGDNVINTRDYIEGEE